MSSSADPKNDRIPANTTAMPWPQALWQSARSLIWERSSPSVEELSFRASYAENVRRNIQHGLVLSMGITLLYLFGPGPIAKMRLATLAVRQLPLFDALRFGVFLPTAAALFAVAYSSLYRRYFARVVQVAMLILVAALTTLEVMIRQQGYSTAVWMAIFLFGIFTAYGLREQQAIRTALLAIAIYFVGAHMTGSVTPQWHFEFGLLLLVMLGAAATQAALFAAERAHHAARLSLIASAERDGLLQIYNRRAFDERIAALWNQAVRTDTSIALFMIDIDFFKNYNDSHGHLAGDDCLTKVAATLSRCARRPMDIVARYGGEEFAVLLYDIDQVAAENTAHVLCANIAALGIPHQASSISNVITVSVGAACVVPTATRSHEGIIQLADEALYSAKQRGRNRAIALNKEYDTLVTGVFRRRIMSTEQAA